MNNTQDQAVQEIPVACTLTSTEQEERGEELAPLFAAVEQVQELADGYAFRFSGDAAWLPQLAEFIAFERECCKFFIFELVCEPGLGPIWLRLRGSEEVKALVATWPPVQAAVAQQAVAR